MTPPPKPATRPAGPASSAAPPKPELKLETPAHKRSLLRWFGIGEKPDHSVEGFVRAIRKAVDDASEINWSTPDDMLEQIEHDIMVALRAPESSVSARWVGSRRTNKAARLLVLTQWGLRETVEGALSFTLFQPGRTPT